MTTRVGLRFPSLPPYAKAVSSSALHLEPTCAELTSRVPRFWFRRGVCTAHGVQMCEEQSSAGFIPAETCHGPARIPRVGAGGCEWVGVRAPPRQAARSRAVLRPLGKGDAALRSCKALAAESLGGRGGGAGVEWGDGGVLAVVAQVTPRALAVVARVTPRASIPTRFLRTECRAPCAPHHAPRGLRPVCASAGT